ncbi:MAG: trimethylamine methyltransferase family protein [Candidatus Eisenbacteria sp.]|nr:trimethylamine methyltransferase family protein [Candidatus Eisenbacteria bacterium]
MKARRPKLEMLSPDLVEKIISEAMEILGGIGVFVENGEAFSLLADAGCKVDQAERRVRIGEDLVRLSLGKAPKSIQVFDAAGDPAMDLAGDNVHFDPGSAAVNVYDYDAKTIRKPTSVDVVSFVKLTARLKNYAAQSTGVVPSDIPEGFADRYRLYLGLLHCPKPVVTGTFEVDAFQPMKDMLVAVRGSEDALREKPLAIFDACPSPPLKWSHLTCQSVLDCARAGIPSEFVSMPLSGATAPVTLSGSIVQHTAETLSGVVIAQLAEPGSPVIYGGSPSIFDMKKGTTPMGAIETMMIDASYTQIGKTLGLPTHAYMALSDSKMPDAQGGLESGMGALMAALCGVNVVSGPGMLAFENCQSLEKLVIDNEICGMALRLVRGVEPREFPMATEQLHDFFKENHLLSHPSTLRWFREEFYFPGKSIDRSTDQEWLKRGSLSALERANDEVQRLLEKDVEPHLEEAVVKTLRKIITDEGERKGVEKLPC